MTSVGGCIVTHICGEALCGRRQTPQSVSSSFGWDRVTVPSHYIKTYMLVWAHLARAWINVCWGESTSNERCRETWCTLGSTLHSSYRFRDDTKKLFSPWRLVVLEISEWFSWNFILAVIATIYQSVLSDLLSGCDQTSTATPLGRRHGGGGGHILKNLYGRYPPVSPFCDPAGP